MKIVKIKELEKMINMLECCKLAKLAKSTLNLFKKMRKEKHSRAIKEEVNTLLIVFQHQLVYELTKNQNKKQGENKMKFRVNLKQHRSLHYVFEYLVMNINPQKVVYLEDQRTDEKDYIKLNFSKCSKKNKSEMLTIRVKTLTDRHMPTWCFISSSFFQELPKGVKKC